MPRNYVPAPLRRVSYLDRIEKAERRVAFGVACNAALGYYTLAGWKTAWLENFYGPGFTVVELLSSNGYPYYNSPPEYWESNNAEFPGRVYESELDERWARYLTGERKTSRWTDDDSNFDGISSPTIVGIPGNYYVSGGQIVAEQGWQNYWEVDFPDFVTVGIQPCLDWFWERVWIRKASSAIPNWRTSHMGMGWLNRIATNAIESGNQLPRLRALVEKRELRAARREIRLSIAADSLRI